MTSILVIYRTLSLHFFMTTVRDANCFSVDVGAAISDLFFALSDLDEVVDNEEVRKKIEEVRLIN